MLPLTRLAGSHYDSPGRPPPRVRQEERQFFLFSLCLGTDLLPAASYLRTNPPAISYVKDWPAYGRSILENLFLLDKKRVGHWPRWPRDL